MHTTYITIKHLNSALRLNISTLCSRLRNKEYVAGSEPHQNALNNLLYFELMADELNILLGHRQSLIKAIEQYLIGEEFDPKSSGGNARSIYQYCLMYFDNVECPLGSSTSELKAWVAMYTDMQRRLEEGYKEFFPNLDFLTQKQGEQDLISVVETAGLIRTSWPATR